VSTSSSRGRGGAHAARHGKPSRRRRGTGAGRSADQDTAQATEDDHSALRETLSPDPRAPWERGDAS
jgi:hypothetical protein